ncbi:hypothetical protein KAR91_27735 [Candidatus Pacearchaeota archaeon]|nr:hypothetical protein [Candidatus Pacearchaeota archaeon]
MNDHMETVLLNRQCQPDGHNTGIFFPYPGTELYDTSIKQGFLKGSVNTQMERTHAIIELPNFTKAQIQRAYIWFNYRVYKGHKPLLVILIQVIAIKVRSNPATNFLFRQIVQLPILRRVRDSLARS